VDDHFLALLRLRELCYARVDCPRSGRKGSPWSGLFHVMAYKKHSMAIPEFQAG
jgi:hypothetical protein